MSKEDNTPKRKYKRKADLNLDDIPSSNRKMKYFKQIRAQKRLKNTISRTHMLIKILSILFILWLSSRIMISKYWFLPQNTFETYPNKNLVIIGNKMTPNDKILNSLKTVSDTKKPIYLINTVAYEKELEKLSPVKKAFVRRYWLPARFEVTIEEQIPVLTIAPNPTAPEIAAITADGRVITKDYLPINSAKYRTYKILTYDDYATWTSHEIVSLNILAERIENFSKEKLLYLDIRNKNDVYAQLETIKIRIGELNSTLKQRIERLTSIMPQIENLKRSTDYVDLRWDNTTYLKKKSKNDASATSIAPAVTHEKKNAEPPKAQIQNDVNKKILPLNTAPKQIQKPMEKPKIKEAVPTKVEIKNEPEPLPRIDIEVVEPDQ